jgi:hypothetical protein
MPGGGGGGGVAGMNSLNVGIIDMRRSICSVPEFFKGQFFAGNETGGSVLWRFSGM